MQHRDVEKAEIAALASAVELTGARVLDVGCGDGRLTHFAAEQAASVYAFDPDADAVKRARASLPEELADHVSFGVHDAHALDVERERFDLALCGWSL